MPRAPPTPRNPFAPPYRRRSLVTRGARRRLEREGADQSRRSALISNRLRFGSTRWICGKRTASSPHAGVVLDAPLEGAHRFRHHYRECEQQHGERPELGHQEIARIQLEQLAIADDRDEQLA